MIKCGRTLLLIALVPQISALLLFRWIFPSFLRVFLAYLFARRGEWDFLPFYYCALFPFLSGFPFGTKRRRLGLFFSGLLLALQRARERGEERDLSMFRRRSQQARPQRGSSSSSSARGAGDVAEGGGEAWPEHFMEALLRRVALQVKAECGVLAAAPAIANVFQVCRTWRAVSTSELLWENLTLSVWDQSQQIQLREDSWREEYIRRHKTASNFHHNRATHYVLEYEGSSDSNNGNGSACRCLALSERYVAGGFRDGSVRVFSTSSFECIRTFSPDHGAWLGYYSNAISGVVLHRETAFFASLYGSILAGDILRGSIRFVFRGNPTEDGLLVDFTGCAKWWIGMYAGNTGHSLNVWNADTEERVFNVGGMTLEPFQGWHLLTEREERRLGRVRICGDGRFVALSPSRIAVLGPEPEIDEDEGEQRIGIQEAGNVTVQILVDSADAKGDRLLYVSAGGVVTVRELTSLRQVLVFRIGGAAAANGGRLLSSLGTWQAFLCINGEVHAWDVNRGDHVYCLSEPLGDVLDLACDDEHVAACSADTGIHLWSFAP